MITIGIIGTRGIPNTYGGFERFVELLVADPVFQDLVTFKIYAEGDACFMYKENVEVIGIGLHKSENPFGYYFWSTLSAAKSCNVVLSCGVGISIASAIPRILGKPLVVNPDGVEWQRSKWKYWQRALVWLMYLPALLFASMIVYDSVALKKKFRLFSWKKSTYIAYQAQINECSFTREASSACLAKLTETPFFLVICRLEPENSVKQIILSWREVALPMNLVIVGNTDTDYFKKELSCYSKEVVFTSGIYDQDDLTWLRRNCRAYIHGHTVGGTNPSLLEAMKSVSAPILAKDTPYNREVLGSQGNYFADQAELCSLMLGVDDCLDNDPERDDDRYAPSKIAKKYLEVFMSA